MVESLKFRVIYLGPKVSPYTYLYSPSIACSYMDPLGKVSRCTSRGG